MDRIILETSDSPEILIEKVNGSLRIKGWDRPEIRLDSDVSDTANVTQQNNTFKIKCNSGCLMRVPLDSLLNIQEVNGEFILKSIEGRVQAEKVNGQAMLKSVGPISIKAVKGNLNARNIEGNFTTERIGGNVILHDVEGEIKVDEIRGNLSVTGYTSGITTYALGNITLHLEPEPGTNVQIRSLGNISCHLSPDTSANISLSSKGQQISVSAFGTKETLQAEEHNFSVGEGEGTISLEANGRIDLNIPTTEDMDWTYDFNFEENINSVAEDISQIVSEQIESQLDSLTIHMNTLSENLAHISPATSEKTRQKLEQKRNQLERKLARLERKTEERTRQAGKRGKSTTRRISYSATIKKSDPVTDEERQQVLKMLQNQQINVQEAELLLAALEGRKPDIPSSPDVS
ncbi:hypothetical protein KQH54_03430 [bacterium]|nr:hypothetical protein [bacterium]